MDLSQVSDCSEIGLFVPNGFAHEVFFISLRLGFVVGNQFRNNFVAILTHAIYGPKLLIAQHMRIISIDSVCKSCTVVKN